MIARGTLPPAARSTETLSVTTVTSEATCSKSKAQSSSSKAKRKSKPIRQVQDEEERKEEESAAEDSDDSAILQILNQAKSGKTDVPPIMVKIKLDDCIVYMEVDTGASVSLMSENTFKTLWPGRSIQRSYVRLRTNLKETIPVEGCTNINIQWSVV